jgi:hypothetical protein
MSTINPGVTQFDVVSLTGANSPFGDSTSFTNLSLTNTTYSLTTNSTLGSGVPHNSTADANATAIATIFKILRDRLGVVVYYGGTNKL